MNNFEDYAKREAVNDAGYRWTVSGSVDEGMALQTLLHGEVIHSRPINPLARLATTQELAQESFDIAWDDLCRKLGYRMKR